MGNDQLQKFVDQVREAYSLIRVAEQNVYGIFGYPEDSMVRAHHIENALRSMSQLRELLNDRTYGAPADSEQPT